MLNVKTLFEVEQMIVNHFGKINIEIECVCIQDALHRVLANDIVAKEYVPDFNRSTVDGYAVVSKDVFGCTESIPAILDMVGKVAMGSAPTYSIKEGQCAYVPTGGQIPTGADAMVMIEYAEDYLDGTIGINKPSAPGQHLIYRGDDVKEGDIILKSGQYIKEIEIGIMAALGISKIFVRKRPIVGIISTGDELIPYDGLIKQGQIRDINTPIFIAALKKLGCEVFSYGIVTDQYNLLMEVVSKAILECDVLLLSGGTSVGEKDITPIVIDELGSLLVHGIAVKPGKPTILGEIMGKPVFGLPGHPVAAYLMFHLLVKKLLYRMQGLTYTNKCIKASLAFAIPSNHGREEYVAVKIKKVDGEVIEDHLDINLIATPIIGKSGLITTLANADGFVCVERNCEGLSKGAIVTVNLF